MTLWKRTRNINIMMPEELLAGIDDLAVANYMSRSDYIRQLFREAIAKHRSKGAEAVREIDPKWLDISDS